MTKTTDVVLLLGGHGQRLGPLTTEVPKYLLPVDGQPLLVHLLDQIVQGFGSARVIMATGRHGDQVKARFGDRYAGLTLEYVQDPRHLETRRRVLSAKEKLRGPFLVVGTDVLASGHQLVRLAERYEKCRTDSVMGIIAAARDHSPTHGHALVEILDGWVTDYLHHPPHIWNSNHRRDMHMYCFAPEALAMLEDAPVEMVWIERVIIWARENGRRFAGESYDKRWDHFAEPKDLDITVAF